MLAEQTTGWGGATSIMLLVAIVLVSSGWGLAAIARRAADGRLGPNHYAGIRTRTTKSSPEAWRAAHQAGLGRTLMGARALMAAGVIAPLVAVGFSADDPDRAMGIWGVTVGVGAVAATAVIISAAVVGQRAAAAVARTGG